MNFLALMKLYFSGLFYKLIFLAEERVSVLSKILIWFEMILSSAVVVYLLDLFNGWFSDNKDFVSFVIITIMINAGLGFWRHKRNNTFNWEEFFKKTGMMILIIILSYILLEMIRSVAGENYVTNAFEALIQVTTLLYPGSKALKSLFILSNGEYPPRWLMTKIYNFENDGNLDNLLGKGSYTSHGKDKDDSYFDSDTTEVTNLHDVEISDDI